MFAFKDASLSVSAWYLSSMHFWALDRQYIVAGVVRMLNQIAMHEMKDFTMIRWILYNQCYCSLFLLLRFAPASGASLCPSPPRPRFFSKRGSLLGLSPPRTALIVANSRPRLFQSAVDIFVGTSAEVRSIELL